MRASLVTTKAFTLVETVIAIFILITVIVSVSYAYINFMGSSVFSQGYQLAIDNIRLGTGKIFNDIRSGLNFDIVSNRLIFADRNCNQIEIFKEGKNLYFKLENRQVPIFDNDLVSLKNFSVLSDDPSGNPDFYFGRSKKIILLNYEFEVKTNKGPIPFKFRQAISPLNSVLPISPCL